MIRITMQKTAGLDVDLHSFPIERTPPRLENLDAAIGASPWWQASHRDGVQRTANQQEENIDHNHCGEGHLRSFVKNLLRKKVVH